MTRIHEELAAEIDNNPAEHLHIPYESNVRHAMVARENRAKEDDDEELAGQLAWERGIMDLAIIAPNLETFYRGDPQRYTEFYRLTEATRSYALERAEETGHPTLRLHHLEYALRTMAQTGREWIELCRRTAGAYREWVDQAIARIQPGDSGTVVCSVDDAMSRLTMLVAPRGVLTDDDQCEWARWIVALAKQLREIEWSESNYNRPHRWPFEILKYLTAIPAQNVGGSEREIALQLVSEAMAFFSAQPLADTLATKAAEVDYELRRHFGEQDAHRTYVRRGFEALRQKAEFFAEQGNRLGAAAMFREAQKVTAEHGQYFDTKERTDLELRERAAYQSAADQGDFRAVKLGVEINPADLDLTKATAEETLAALAANALRLVPNIKGIIADAKRAQEAAPLSSLFPGVIVDKDKVVRETLTKDQHLDADVEMRVGFHARIVGKQVHVTLQKAAKNLGLEPVQIVESLSDLPGARARKEILLQAVERFLRDDYISAAHVLAPHFEDTLRKMLRAIGFVTSKLKVVDADTRITRTDDTTLGALLRLSDAEIGTVKDLLGDDLWHYIDVTMVSPSGLNLRNRFAHGFARSGDCVPDVVGIMMHLLLCLAVIARRWKAEEQGQT